MKAGEIRKRTMEMLRLALCFLVLISARKGTCSDLEATSQPQRSEVEHLFNTPAEVQSDLMYFLNHGAEEAEKADFHWQR